MTYQEHHAIATAKASRYPINACKFAIADCHETLKIMGDCASEDYRTKLWAEIDAMRERIARLEARQARPSDRRIDGYSPEFLGAKPAKAGEDY